VTEPSLITLRNANGVAVTLTDLGARIVRWLAPDRTGKFANIVLGFDTAAEYRNDTAYMGCTVGRFANRIGNSRFVLGGVEYRLSANEGAHHLHGGIEGFDKRVWQYVQNGNSVQFRLESPDGDQGYPGNLRASAAYSLDDDDRLVITYEAETDTPTIVNFTNHAYFNLSGDQSRTVLDHTLRLNASRYTPVDDELIPTGEIADVQGTQLDFRSARLIGDGFGDGFDHNFVLDGANAARLEHSESGRVVEIETTQPAIQFYSGNFLNGSPFDRHTGLCLETQGFPDSPNKPNFPSTTLGPGEKYRHRCVLKCSTN
jgi:aldose 1-epimerase